MSVFLCCAMLVGTTYAWFSDTATSGTNTVTAGKLDVSLWVKGENDEGSKETDDAEFFKADKDTLLFQDKMDGKDSGNPA